METSFVLLCVILAECVTPVLSAAEPGILERLLLAAHQRPWLWGLYVFTVGLPIILFVSLMWPDKRFGPPDQQYYYKKSDEAQPDDVRTSQDREGHTTQTVSRRRRDTELHQRKSDLDS